jgi:predicted TIM-barrel fold metal-dependent hydrolase
MTENETNRDKEAQQIPRREVLRVGLGASLAGLGGAGIAQASAQPQEAGQGPKENQEFPIIDAHNHPNWHGHNAKKIVENMDQHGIQKTWLLSWEVPEHEISPAYHSSLDPRSTGIPFGHVVDAAEQYPDRFIPGHALDPRHPYAQDRLRAAVAIHGVRVYGELKARVVYDDPDCIGIFHVCAELGLPVVFHLDVVLPRDKPQTKRQWWYGGHIDNVERALRACPDTNFLGHAPGFWREISGDAEEEPGDYPRGQPVKPGGRLLKLLDKYPNLHCDLSAGSGYTALDRDHEFTRKFLVAYQDRCLFGRDDFDGKLYELLQSLSLPRDVLKKILGGNARRLVPGT